MALRNPYTLHEAEVALWRANGNDGAPFRDAANAMVSVPVGRCLANLRLRATRALERPRAFADDIGRDYDVEEDFLIEIEGLYGNEWNAGERPSQHPEVDELYILTAVAQDEVTREWVKHTYWWVKATADEISHVAPLLGFSSGYIARARDIVRGAGAKPSLEPDVRGVVEYLRDGQAIPAYHFDFTGGTFTLAPENDAGGGTPKYVDINDDRIRVHRGVDGWQTAVNFPTQTTVTLGRTAYLGRPTLPPEALGPADQKTTVRFRVGAATWGTVSAYGDLAAPSGDEVNSPGSALSFTMGSGAFVIGRNGVWSPNGDLIETV